VPQADLPNPHQTAKRIKHTKQVFEIVVNPQQRALLQRCSASK